jgi:hypothetical protein
LAADFEFAIGDQKNLRACTLANVCQLSTLKVFEPTHHGADVQGEAPDGGALQPFVQFEFAFCRCAASAPPIRICSTESVASEAAVEIACSWF